MVPAPHLVDARLLHVPVRLVNGIFEFPKATRISHNEAVAHFLKAYPQGFKDPTLIDDEISYKRDAVRLFRRLFGGSRGRDLLREKKYDEVATGIDRLFHATNIPVLQEILAVRDGVKDRVAAASFLSEVLNFAQSPGATEFDRLVAAVDSLPADLGKAPVLRWPIVTLLPFLADPRRFIVLKPSMTKRQPSGCFSTSPTTVDRIGPRTSEHSRSQGLSWSC